MPTPNRTAAEFAKALQRLAAGYPLARRISDLRTLRSEAKAWNRRVNRDRVMIHWRFTSNDALAIFHAQADLFTRSEN
jgi:hypothetical protein